ncbi:MAG TPA: branched-chain amino acid ABC transporter permease [Methylomirabilota bacterium]|nr:branched-chain amino acid ABC transporter permease [Methylomirabilota bacterium]
MSSILAILFDGVVYSSWLFMMAAGLTLIYGVMRILNIAHGSLYALGAYAAATIAGAWLAAGYAPVGSYAMLALAAVLVGVVVGPLVERGLLRRMYGQDEVVLLLVTYAAFLMLEDAIKLVWGVESKLLTEPYSLPGNFHIGALAYPRYNLVLITVAIVTGLALAWALYRTRQGKLLLAVIHDREISAAMGINVTRVYLVTFTLGSMLAGLGGALTAPTIAVSPGIGVEVIVLSFAVVVVGGLGSLGGAALGALLVGVVRSFAVRYWPEAELFTIYGVMALVLIARPKGLFSAPEARKI